MQTKTLMFKPDFKGYAVASVQALIIVTVLIAVLMCFIGCTTTKYVTVPEVHTDTVRITQLQRDSIFTHDSIYVSEKTKGDTVYLTTERWHTRYQDRWLCDTIYRSRADSIPVPVPVEKKVPAELNWFQQMRLWLGNLVLIALAVCIGWTIFRIIRKIRRV